VQGKISIQTEPIDLARTTMEAVESLQGLINSREQRLTIEVDPAPSVVIGDRARLRQIQENLLSNASKFTPRGGSIDLTLRREGDEILIRVRDSGRGIASDMQDAIFELFTQVEGPIDRSDGGMGIGLTMVRHLVHLHGGRVAVRSDGPGRGSEFEVRLPAATTQTAPVSDGVGARDGVDGRAPVAQRVLVIEDNPDAREALAMVLELEGFSVTCEPDGERGLSTLVDDPPNVALVDIGLPGLNGFDLAKRARERLGRDRVRLVALTGYGSQEDRRKVREAGFDAHLVKPVTREALRRVLDGKN
jgi:two-component system CheB/CheR fusion protein